MKKKKPSLLNENDVFNLKQIDWALNQNEEESVSQASLRYGDMPDEDLLRPAQKAHESLCKDNPKLDSESFNIWRNELIEDSNLFRLDKIMIDAVKEAKAIFDSKISEWIEEGIVSSNYDTGFAFWGIIGIVLYNYSILLGDKKSGLHNEAFFSKSLLGKYKITALEDEDDSTLNNFQNTHSYDRFDVEAIQLYVMERYEWLDRHAEICDIYNEVKEIVYEDPNRKLSETKAKLELLTKSSGEKRFQYALLYACTVIERSLNK